MSVRATQPTRAATRMTRDDQVRVSQALNRARMALRLCRDAGEAHGDPVLVRTMAVAIEAVEVNRNDRGAYEQP